MPETTALGAAMAAGLADGIAVWNLDSTVNNTDTSADIFTASIPESSQYDSAVTSRDRLALQIGPG